MKQYETIQHSRIRKQQQKEEEERKEQERQQKSYSHRDNP